MRTIRLHVKVLKKPNLSIRHQLNCLRQAYKPAGIKIVVVSTEFLDLPQFLQVEVNRNCPLNHPSAAQIQLFKHRNQVGDREIAVYYTGSICPGNQHGCAAHPPGQPGVIIAHTALKWTLAHEIGHALGLKHVFGDNRRLMSGHGTEKIIATLPGFNADELRVIHNSNLIF